MGEAAVNIISCVTSNPILRELVLGVASNAAWDALKKIIDRICERFKNEPDVFNETDIEKMRKLFKDELEKSRGNPSPISKKATEMFEKFLLPSGVILDNIGDDLCDYVAERMYYGVAFQSFLHELDFKKIEYLYSIPSGYVRRPYHFDVKGVIEMDLVPDTLLTARIIDNRYSNLLDTTQAIPTHIDEINYHNSIFKFKDYDYYVLIHTGDIDFDIRRRIKEILRNFQINKVYLPRLLYIDKNEIDDMIKLKNEDRKKLFKRQLIDMRVDRGI